MTLAGTSSPAYAELLEQNRRFLWNPFTQMKDYLADRPVVVERWEGVKLVVVNGVEYHDGSSSLWVHVDGHNRAELSEAIVRQREHVAHSTLLGMASVPALELAERLVELTPPRLAKVFYSDSGATAVEIGLKLAFAYWRRVGRPEKNVFVAFDNGYHGDTIGSMSVGGIDLFHAEFGPLLFPCERVSFPHAYRFPGSEEECAQASLAELEALYHGHSFTGNQLGCAVAVASLDLFEQDALIARVRESARLVAGRLGEVAEFPHVGDVRQRGLMVGIELVADRETKEPFDWRERTGQRVCVRARELGMLTRPLGDVVVFMPPLASEQADLEAMTSILHRAIADVTGG